MLCSLTPGGRAVDLDQDQVLSNYRTIDYYMNKPDHVELPLIVVDQSMLQGLPAVWMAGDSTLVLSDEIPTDFRQAFGGLCYKFHSCEDDFNRGLKAIEYSLAHVPEQSILEFLDICRKCLIQAQTGDEGNRHLILAQHAISWAKA